MTSFISKITLFMKYDLWRMDLSSLSTGRAFAIKWLRILVASLRGFMEDNCSLRAAALTLSALLSVVPVLAMAFGIAQGFGLEKAIEKELMVELQGQEEVARWLINFAYSFLHSTKGGLIAGIGFLALLLTVVKILRNIEISFNAIWKTRVQRNIPRTISDYLAVTIIAPILLIASSSLTVVVTREFGTISNQIMVFGYITPVLLPLLKLLPYCVIWVLFTFIYMSMPNTKVKFSSGLLGGVIAGTIFQVFQWAYISFQVGVSKYNAIYGSFAALPLFIVWLQTSWLIVLLGAEISYAHQNSANYEYDPDAAKISHSFRMLLALNICHMIIKKFQTGERCCTLRHISRTIQIPVSLAQRIIVELLGAGLISATDNDYSQPHQGKAKEGDRAVYQPAASIDKFSIKYVLDVLEQHGSTDLPVNTEHGLKQIEENVRALNDAVAKAPANTLLKDL